MYIHRALLTHIMRLPNLGENLNTPALVVTIKRCRVWGLDLPVLSWTCWRGQPYGLLQYYIHEIGASLFLGREGQGKCRAGAKQPGGTTCCIKDTTCSRLALLKAGGLTSRCPLRLSGSGVNVPTGSTFDAPDTQGYPPPGPNQGAPMTPTRRHTAPYSAIPTLKCQTRPRLRP